MGENPSEINLNLRVSKQFLQSRLSSFYRLQAQNRGYEMDMLPCASWEFAYG